MTGLIARLAARAAGEVPVAAPRIPSRYEPLPEELGVPEPLPPEAVDTAPCAATGALPVPQDASRTGHPTAHPLAAPVPPRAAPFAVVPPSPVVVPLAAPAPAPAAVARRREASPAAASPDGNGRTPTADAAPRPDTNAPAATGGAPHAGTNAPAAADRPRTPRQEAASKSSGRTAHNAGEAKRTVVATALEVTEAIVSPPPPAVPDAPATAARADATALRLAEDAAAAPATGRSPSLPDSAVSLETVHLVAGHRAAPRAAEIAARQPAAPNAPAAPVIEIHIGSVEVRASSAPAPPAPRPARAPTSLDDFLHGRGG